MKISLTIFILICFFLFGCKKTSDNGSDCDYTVCYLKGIVIDTSDVACLHPVIDFSEDSTRIFAVTNRHELQYIIHKLPTSFNVLNKKLYLSISTDVSKDSFACHAYGTPYHLVHFLDAKDRR